MPESSLRVVALIVTWNRREAAAGVIRALRAQRGHGARIRAIVVDNASTDGTAEALAREFRLSRMLVNDTERADAPRIAEVPDGLPSGPLEVPDDEGARGIEEIVLVCNRHNLGGTGGFNTAMRALDSGAAFPGEGPPDFAWLLDDDIDLPPDALARLLEGAGSDARIGLVGSRTCDLNQRERTIETTIYIDAVEGVMRDEPPEGHPGRAGHLAWAREVGGPKGGTGYAGLRDVDVVSACSMLARWSAVREVGFWDDRFFIYCDDADWCWRMRRAGWRVVLNLDAVVYHTPWFAKLTPARAYYAQRNLLWMLGTNHPQPRETVRRRIDAICRDAWRHALRRRGLHAEALRRACADACRGVSGKAKGLDPVPLDLAGELQKVGRVIAAVQSEAGVAASRTLRAGQPGRLWVEFIRNDVPGAHDAEPGVKRVVHSVRGRSLLRRHLGLLRAWRAPVVVFSGALDVPLVIGGETWHVGERGATRERGGLVALARFWLALGRTRRRARAWADRLAPPAQP